ncbi:Oidioi.mRNA.OKI2018_I69.chr2.g6722.t1.cds [Oikopleura dioica]|uniref:Oidioi.mRNA.OKI2018_I69.chr2.g6722.t1.cds n=1 Tax=Oikopleura dioica TaxID=34765 RepID=A0ABN7T4K7_OIKDI|nr:Oidioi.mRNA.OKI2018_I69.chr2.g6722.t1.cds [Oikopleura dioica]
MAYSSIPEIKEFHKRISEKSEALISKEFPSKVAQLDEICNSEKWSLDRLNQVHSAGNTAVVANRIGEAGDEPPTKRTRTENGPSVELKSNEILLELIDELKPEVSSLMEHSANIRIWITLLVPKIEDGNNFGVSVQEDTLAELRQVEAECAQYLDQISRYYLTRGKMLSKCVKYPQIADYKRCIQELDTKQFVSLRFMLSEIRNHHCFGVENHNLTMNNTNSSCL